MTKSPVRQMSFDESRFEWYTPDWFMESVHAVMTDGIDFDPASSDIANTVVRAKQFYTQADDGLVTPWPKTAKTIYMNPPYNTGLIYPFCEKFMEFHLQYKLMHGIVVINNATETKYFQLLAKHARHVCFPRKRIIFNNPDGSPSYGNVRGQAVLYFSHQLRFEYGPESFVKEFSKHGIVL